MTGFILDYLLWVFVCAVAVLQAVAAWSGLSGLLFFRRWPAATLRVSLGIVALAYAWYFASGRRNHPDTGLGLDGPSQAQWFAVAAGAAFLFTLLVSSIVNHRWAAAASPTSESASPPSGADVLRRTTFARALVARLPFVLRHSKDERETSEGPMGRGGR